MPTFRKLTSGKWNVQVRKRGFNSQSKTFLTKKSAEIWAKKIESEMERNLFIQESGITVAELFEKYEKNITPKKQGIKQELSRIGVIVKRIGHLYVEKLTAKDIIEYVDERKGEGISGETIKKELNKLGHAIKTGESMWGLVMRLGNPVYKARNILSATKALEPYNARDRRLTEEEYEVLVLHKHGHIYSFAIETAMRRGEIFRAKPSDRKGNTLHIPLTKTGESRTVALSKAACSILDSIKVKPNEPYFSYIEPKGVSDALTKLYRKNGWENLRFHDLRHEAISRLFEKGLSIQEVASISGHKDWRTLQKYTHLKPEDVAKKLG